MKNVFLFTGLLAACGGGTTTKSADGQSVDTMVVTVDKYQMESSESFATTEVTESLTNYVCTYASSPETEEGLIADGGDTVCDDCDIYSYVSFSSFELYNDDSNTVTESDCVPDAGYGYNISTGEVFIVSGYWVPVENSYALGVWAEMTVTCESMSDTSVECVGSYYKEESTDTSFDISSTENILRISW